MYLINRTAAVVKLRPPFVDWVNSCPGPGKFTLQNINRESHVYMLPEHDTER